MEVNMSGAYRNNGKCKFCSKENYSTLDCASYMVRVERQLEVRQRKINQGEPKTKEAGKTMVEHGVIAGTKD